MECKLLWGRKENLINQLNFYDKKFFLLNLSYEPNLIAVINLLFGRHHNFLTFMKSRSVWNTSGCFNAFLNCKNGLSLFLDDFVRLLFE